MGGRTSSLRVQPLTTPSSTQCAPHPFELQKSITVVVRENGGNKHRGAWQMGTRFSQGIGFEQEETGSVSLKHLPRQKLGHPNRLSVLRERLHHRRISESLSVERRAFAKQAEIPHKDAADYEQSPVINPLRRRSLFPVPSEGENEEVIVNKGRTAVVSWDEKNAQGTIVELEGADADCCPFDMAFCHPKDNTEEGLFLPNMFVSGAEVMLNGEAEATISDFLGHGCFGQQLYTVLCKLPVPAQQREIHLSMIHFPEHLMTSQLKYRLYKEIFMLNKLIEVDKVVKLEFVFADDISARSMTVFLKTNARYISLNRYMDGGSGVLYSGRCKEELARDIISICKQTAECLLVLHQHGYIHQDLKPDSLLINPKTLQVKLCNFTLTKEGTVMEQGLLMAEFSGYTAAYRSPETLQVVDSLQAAFSKDEYNEILAHNLITTQMTDLWAYGLLVLQLYFGKVVWEENQGETGGLFYESLHPTQQVEKKRHPARKNSHSLSLGMFLERRPSKSSTKTFFGAQDYDENSSVRLASSTIMDTESSYARSTDVSRGRNMDTSHGRSMDVSRGRIMDTSHGRSMDVSHGRMSESIRSAVNLAGSKIAKKISQVLEKARISPITTPQHGVGSSRPNFIQEASGGSKSRPNFMRQASGSSRPNFMRQASGSSRPNFMRQASGSFRPSFKRHPSGVSRPNFMRQASGESRSLCPNGEAMSYLSDRRGSGMSMSRSRRGSEESAFRMALEDNEEQSPKPVIRTPKGLEIPPEILEVLTRCFNKNAMSRPKSFSEIIELLDGASKGFQIANDQKPKIGLAIDVLSAALPAIKIRTHEMNGPGQPMPRRASKEEGMQHSFKQLMNLQYACFMNNLGIILQRDISVEQTQQFTALALQHTAFSNALLLQASAECFLAALKVESRSPTFLLNLGHVRYLQARYEDSINLCLKCQENNNSAEVQMLLALSLQKIGEMDRAMEAYESAMFFCHGNSGVLSNCGILFLKKKQYKEAEDYFKQALNADSSNYHITFNLGLLYYHIENFSEAIEIFESCLQRNQDDFEVLCSLAMALTKAARLPESLIVYKNALHLQPEHTGVLFNIATNMMEEKLYTEALKIFEKVVELDPTDIDAFNNIGNILSLLGQHNLAVEKYREAYSLYSPQNQLTLVNLAHALIDTERYNEALGVLHQLMINPGDYTATILAKLLETYIKLQRQEDGFLAIERFIQEQTKNSDQNDAALMTEKMLALAESLVENDEREMACKMYEYSLCQEDLMANLDRMDSVKMVLANLYFDLQKFDDATLLYKEFLSLNPDSIPVIVGLSQVYMQEKRFNEARSTLEHGHSLEPQNASLIKMLAEVYAETGETIAALNMYQTMLLTHPDDAVTRNNVGCLLVLTGRMQEAAEQFKLACNAAPEEPSYLYNLGHVLKNMGDHEHAISIYLQCLLASPNNSEILLDLSHAYLCTERYTEAHETLSHLKHLTPNSQEVAGMILLLEKHMDGDGDTGLMRAFHAFQALQSSGKKKINTTGNKLMRKMSMHNGLIKRKSFMGFLNQKSEIGRNKQASLLSQLSPRGTTRKSMTKAFTQAKFTKARTIVRHDTSGPQLEEDALIDQRNISVQHA